MRAIPLVLILTLFAATNATAQEMTALSCNDFRPTDEAIERFPDLLGACEGIVERNGELYGLFRADVRRVWGNNVTLHLPATGKTFTARPDSSMRVLIDGKKTRARDLTAGQEIRIYLSVSEFSKPDIEEVAWVTEEDVVVSLVVEDAPALPTTASPWPMIGAAGLFLLGAGYLMRRRRLGSAAPLALLFGASLLAGSPAADAESKVVQVPARVITSTVRSMAIVEAVNKETREIKLIDAHGKRFTIVASDMVKNFDQIEPRDRIVTEYLESIAVFVVPAGASELGDAALVEIAAPGDKPGISAAETFMVKATVESLNMTDKIATLRAEDGTIRSVKIADDVPLEMVSVGDEVRLRITHAMAISVRKADKS